MNRLFVPVMRWTARIAGSLIALLFLAIFVGESLSAGPPNLLERPLPEIIEFGAIILAWLGLLLAWRLQMLGGLYTLVGLLIFMIVEGKLWINWVFGLLGLVGLVHLLCGALTEKRMTMRH